MNLFKKLVVATLVATGFVAITSLDGWTTMGAIGIFSFTYAGVLGFHWFGGL